METQDKQILRDRAEIFLRNDIRVYIKDCYNNYHFCFIKEIFDDWLIVKHFKGNRAGTNTRILWIDILKLEEYREVRE